MEQLLELVSFLRDPKKEVRFVAVQNLVPFTQSIEAQTILMQSEKLIINLKILTSDVDYIAKEAYVCLLQLSTNSHFCQRMITDKLIPILMDVICDKDSPYTEIPLIILGNITRSIEGTRTILQVDTDYEGVYLFKLIERFCMSVEDPNNIKEDKFQWIAPIITNISQTPQGRNILLENDANLLFLTIASANITESPIRKRGIASTIKNCCFNPDSHEKLLNLGILNFIIAPMVGINEQFSEEEIEKMPVTGQKIFLMTTRVAESDLEIINPLLESVVLLCSTRSNRDFLRNHSVYPIMRELDKTISNEETKQIIINVVDMLVRDEDSAPELPDLPEETEQ